MTYSVESLQSRRAVGKILRVPSDPLIQKYAERLRRLARKSDRNNKHAAILLDKKLSPICADFNRLFLHAEEAVIFKWKRAYMPRKRRAYMIVVIRISGKNGKEGFAMSKPCEKCQVLIDLYGLEVVHS